mgnify:CR=1 FL=1
MDIQDVENLAELARIDLTLEEKQELLKDFDSILAYVKQVESVEVPDVHPELLIYNSFREDSVIDRDFSIDSIKEQFPDSQDGFLKVKKIL